MLSVVAMSGGVDSSVAAALTAERHGNDRVLGISLRLYSTDEHAARSGRSCCAPDDLYDARRAAAALGIRFYVYDAQERFRGEVIDDFVRAYARGETPNPCVRCNQEVKFDWLLDRARRVGAGELVTGHYARIERGADGEWRLLRARDAAKDQSYFLHGLTQDELAFVRFPLGELTKPQVRDLARGRGLPNADKTESMEVCFVAGRPVAEFLEAHGVAPAHGEIVDTAGRVLGEHGGIHRFTVGQRRGLAYPTSCLCTSPRWTPIARGSSSARARRWPAARSGRSRLPGSPSRPSRALAARCRSAIAASPSPRGSSPTGIPFA